MVQILEYTEGKLIAAKATKKITDSDYYKLLPLFVNSLKQHPNIRLYFEIGDLEGLELNELSEDVGFNTALSKAFDKVAMLGDKKQERWIKNLIKPFTSAQVKCFDIINREDAITWIKSEN